MHFSSLIALTPLLAVSDASAIPFATIGSDILAAKGLVNLAGYQIQQFFQGVKQECNIANAAVRREWGTLSNTERKSYTDAVLCLMSKPSITDPTLVPGAKSRYDDFLYTHINQTLSIHGTGNFLFWHRYFTWTYEKALREECGYTGYQPYWNWGKWAADPLSSPIFDGSEYSMSGNGEYAPHGCTQALPTGLNCVPDDGTGGGCVTTGPFKDITVNLGPVSPTLTLTTVNSTVTANNGTVYNPRCLRRAVSSWVSTRYTSDKNVTDLITNKKNIADFQTTMQGNFATGEYGVHTGGHFTIGGDPGGDIFTSPGDPAFYLHHAQIDRTWWIWQNQDPAGRRNVVGDTITLNNSPASRNATLDDLVNLGVNAPDMTLRYLASTTAGPFCYIYI